MKRFKDILFVVETGETCEPALERAVTLAESNQARLTVVVVVERINADIEMPDGAPDVGRSETTEVNQSAAGYAISGNHPRGTA